MLPLHRAICFALVLALVIPAVSHRTALACSREYIYPAWVPNSIEVDNAALPDGMSVAYLTKTNGTPLGLQFENMSDGDLYLFQRAVRDRADDTRETVESALAAGGLSDAFLNRNGWRVGENSAELVQLGWLIPREDSKRIDANNFSGESFQTEIWVMNAERLWIVPVVVSFEANPQGHPPPPLIWGADHELERQLSRADYVAVGRVAGPSTRSHIDRFGEAYSSAVNRRTNTIIGAADVRVSNWLLGQGENRIVVDQFGFGEDCLPILDRWTRSGTVFIMSGYDHAQDVYRHLAIYEDFNIEKQVVAFIGEDFEEPSRDGVPNFALFLFPALIAGGVALLVRRRKANEFKDKQIL